MTIPMLTVVLTCAALVLVLASAIGRAPLWVSVFVLGVALLLVLKK